MAKSLWLKAKLIIVLVMVMVAVHLVNEILGGRLMVYGVIPRSIDHWMHIFSAPFIHGSTGHLLNNLLGLSLFSALCLIRSVKFFLYSSVFIIVFCGVLIWFFGRNASHIGASGWIFGLWSLSIAMAWFDRRLLNIIIALLVVFLYGGMVYGVLPTDPRVSFEAHLFGAIAGVLCAFFSVLLTDKKSRNLKGGG